MNLPKRKQNRLQGYDYTQNGAYFITVCVKDSKCILSTVSVGNAVPGVPQNDLSKYGKITEKVILQMQNFYDDIYIDKYIIMPNHLHLIMVIDDVPRTLHPTVSDFIGTMKRLINREIGENIWQKSFYDHIIRDDEDYYIKARYIEENPIRWCLKNF